jgi:hypothetical protein
VSASASSGGDDFSVKASAASRTITATYSYEGTYMQIVLQLDKCHPLRTVEVSRTASPKQPDFAQTYRQSRNAAQPSTS